MDLLCLIVRRYLAYTLMCVHVHRVYGYIKRVCALIISLHGVKEVYNETCLNRRSFRPTIVFGIDICSGYTGQIEIFPIFLLKYLYIQDYDLDRFHCISDHMRRATINFTVYEQCILSLRS